MLRLDDDIRALANEMQRRRQEAAKRVMRQEIIGMRFMSDKDLWEAQQRNLGRDQLTLTDLADGMVYSLEIIRRNAETGDAGDDPAAVPAVTHDGIKGEG